jgi:long-subunit acyl-CoA synthetase (AMP-forming)
MSSLTFTGTTGLPKGVLSTQRQYLTNVLNVLSALLFSVYIPILPS